MSLLRTEIEIALPPSVVREKFLEFDKIPTYHNNFILSLSPTTPGQPLEPGNRLHVVLKAQTFDPPITANTPTLFSWYGSLPLGLFNGEHRFHFLPHPSCSSNANPQKTLLVQEEEFSGVLGFIIGEGFVGRWLGLRDMTRKGFESYNVDFKGWCER